MVLDVQGCAVVVLGNFNPPILTPAWLRLHGLISDEVLEAAEVDAIVPPLCRWKSTWFSVHVEPHRFQLSTTEPHERSKLRDLALGIFDALPETPVAVVGVNREAHWSAPDFGSYNDFGDLLVPKQHWQDAVLRLPGLRDLTVEGTRADDFLGYQRVTVQPSERPIPFGLFAKFNDHFILRKVESQPETREDFLALGKGPPVEPDPARLALLRRVLTDGWAASMADADRAISSLYRLSVRGTDGKKG